ncbi:MAG: hypothetical protein E3K32_03310 [wastewater metagenome]|nr:hypothetical protein [Candidatus Loosdrechtia aerotolerans]
MRQFILSVLFIIGFLGYAQSLQAKVYTPVVIEPYSEESLRIINWSLSSFKTSFDRVKEDSAGLLQAVKKNKANQTPENAAHVTEKAGQVLYTTIEFVRNGQESIQKVVPELQNYRKYLLKISASMENEENSLLSERANWVKEEAKNIERLINGLGKTEKDLKLIKNDLAMLTTAWLHSEQIRRELRKGFGGGKIGSLYRDLSGVVDTLSDIKGIITGLLKDSSLGSVEEYEEGIEAYNTSVRNYFGGVRR